MTMDLQVCQENRQKSKNSMESRARKRAGCEVAGGLSANWGLQIEEQLLVTGAELLPFAGRWWSLRTRIHARGYFNGNL